MYIFSNVLFVFPDIFLIKKKKKKEEKKGRKKKNGEREWTWKGPVEGGERHARCVANKENHGITMSRRNHRHSLHMKPDRLSIPTVFITHG